MTIAHRFALAALVFLAACGTSPSPSAPADLGSAAEWPRCTGDTYSIAYPQEWFVHPADEAIGIGACQLFAAEPFSNPEPEDESDGGWSGAQVVLAAGSGCRGSFEVVVSQEEVKIDGHQAWVQVQRPGHGDSRVRAYEYFVSLTPERPCEASEWFYARTESDDPGPFEENAATLDEMVSTLSFDGR